MEAATEEQKADLEDRLKKWSAIHGGPHPVSRGLVEFLSNLDVDVDRLVTAGLLVETKPEERAA